MSILKFSKLKIPGANLNEQSSLPPIAEMINVQQKAESNLGEDDGLFIGYGYVNGSFPYLHQDLYDRTSTYKEFESVILENKYLKATFIPSLGGRLWTLFDKVANKELTFSNSVFQPGNLAVRNAWFSGGVEWNCGVVGHHPYTCSPMFVSTLTADDGTPVLRMYEFERIRCAVYQMDFFLPEDSKMLLCRMRIVNPNYATIPMYWWSNIAVPELEDGRVVVAAKEAYTNKSSMVCKATVPYYNDVDITYPINNKIAVDYFWKIKPGCRKYICHVDRNGYGLVQTSTNLLKGRKLFVWGQGTGGDNWKEFLSQKGDGKYVEIQAGLAHTQYECIPMPPKTAWEWIEAYGAINTDSNKVHGQWEDAQSEVEDRLSHMIKAEDLEQMLIDTRESIALKPGKLVSVGSGWGALENLRRLKCGEKPLPPHLDFGHVTDEQQQWVELLESGYFNEQSPLDPPKSWMNQPEWVAIIEKSLEGADKYNWYSWLQIGIVYLSEKRYKESKKALHNSMTLKPSPWALYGLSQLATMEGDIEKAALLTERAYKMKSSDVSLAKEAMRKLVKAKLYTKAIKLCDDFTEEISNLGRIKLLKARAYLGVGNIQAAEDILYKSEQLQVPDVREGEDTVTELWFNIEEKKAALDGKEFNRNNNKPPKNFDFRMFV